MSTIEMGAPATGVEWFKLTRHAEDDPADPAADPAPEGDGDDEEAQRLLAEAAAGDDPEDDEPEPGEGDDPPKDGLGEAGKKALDRMKAEKKAALKAAADAKRELAALNKKVQAFEDRDKSELEKATAKAERLADQATKATARAVQAEVRSLAVGQFADATDAVDVLMRDPSKYVDGDTGDIDTDAIEADLSDLLERKPHWAKPEPAAPVVEPEKKPKPKPDPGQGSRGAPAKVDFRTASDEEYAAELAKYGVRKRY